jgi:Tryptophan RNA-binding attenuator protein inhibitory protein
MGVAEPWEEICSSCDGTGRAVVPEWARWQEEYDRLAQIANLADRLRALADHVQRAPAEAEQVTCPECAGEGVIVTEQGRALLDFLDRRFGTRPPHRPTRSDPSQVERARPPLPSSYFQPPRPAGGNSSPSPPAGAQLDVAPLPAVPPVLAPPARARPQWGQPPPRDPSGDGPTQA